uniref:Lin-9 DREAM MuvB core complex component n=1 Tax=Eptatretus burgeri TaxID=7764 RepID=A0A8C4QKK5_EPTBU
MAESESLLDESSSAQALVSLKEGSLSGSWNLRTPPRTTSPESSLKARKRTRQALGEEVEKQASPGKSPRRTNRLPVPHEASTPDKRCAQRVGIRLRNLLKLPKANRWCIFEWFYANIDRPLFEGDNDFCICLHESFPQLKTRHLTRVQWSTIRRLMGKPRRCSEAFFAEERSTLRQKREKIRMLQQQQVMDLSNFKDLPEEIPLPLVIGTKVTARLRGIHDGLFMGQIDAVDTYNATYRVTFDRTGLGTHTIHDVEVVSNQPQDSMPIMAFAQKQRPSKIRVGSPQQATMISTQLPSPQLDRDPVFTQASWQSRLLTGDSQETLGGFPVKFLMQVTRLSKVLAMKKKFVKQLRNMNADAEWQRTFSEPLCVEFQKRYAGVVLQLERLNKDLNRTLHAVQQHCRQLAPEQGLQPMDEPLEVQLRCKAEAQETVQQRQAQPGSAGPQSEALTTLVARLTALLLHIKYLAEGDLNSFEFKSLTDSLEEIKSSLDPSNTTCFENNVEVHVAHIQSGLSQMGNLHAFSASEDCTRR